MGQKSNTFLEAEKIGKLMEKYSIPCIISLLVRALYNIMDQIFIANASYPGLYGNEANTVVFPLTVATVIGQVLTAVLSDWYLFYMTAVFISGGRYIDVCFCGVYYLQGL